MTDETGPEEDGPNEIVAAALAAKRQGEAAVEAVGRSRNWPLAALGVSVGSAAVAGALIFAGRQRRRK